ncbi:MAG: dihydroorotate dehydrogenase [Candidatus Njordarchaeales archaeon]
MVDLSVRIGKLQLRNPTMLASGILGDKASLLERAYRAGAGAVVTKSFTREPREGYATPIIVGVPCGFINAVGLANPGKDGLKSVLEKIRGKFPVIVSIAGATVEEFVELAVIAEDYGADGLELNMSCPHAERRGLEIGSDPSIVGKIVEDVKQSVKIPIFVKLGLSDNIFESCKQAEEAGADALVLINTIRAMKIDIWIRKPVLSHKYGGLSGQAIHPIAVFTVYRAYEIVDIPVIGVGGVTNWEDAVEFLLAGASAVQIGSSLALKGYNIFSEIVNGIRHYLEKIGFSSVRDIIGLAHEE